MNANLLDSIDDYEAAAVLKTAASMDHWDQLIEFVNDQIDTSIVVDQKKNYGMKLAIEELISNIIRSNESPGSEAYLEVTAYKDPSRSACVMLQTKDNGQPFDPCFDEISDDIASTPIEHRKIGGLGLYLVKKSVDCVAYKQIDGCNVYRLLSSDSVSSSS